MAFLLFCLMENFWRFSWFGSGSEGKYSDWGCGRWWLDFHVIFVAVDQCLGSHNRLDFCFISISMLLFVELGTCRNRVSKWNPYSRLIPDRTGQGPNLPPPLLAHLLDGNPSDLFCPRIEISKRISIYVFLALVWTYLRVYLLLPWICCSNTFNCCSKPSTWPFPEQIPPPFNLSPGLDVE